MLLRVRRVVRVEVFIFGRLVMFFGVDFEVEVGIGICMGEVVDDGVI